MTTTTRVLDDIAAERHRQDERWGEQLHLVGEGDAAEVPRQTITRPLRVPLPTDLAWWAA